LSKNIAYVVCAILNNGLSLLYLGPLWKSSILLDEARWSPLEKPFSMTTW